MASVYILYSPSLNEYYIGSCKNLQLRINDHLSKCFPDACTAKVTNWTIHFEVNDLEYSQARKIEIHIKNMKSRTNVENLKKYPEIVNKLTSKFK